jgi:hypothetical protein
VVDDPDSRAVLDRTPIAVPDGGSATVLAVADREIFLAEGPGGFPVGGSLRQYDVARARPPQERRARRRRSAPIPH